MKTLVHACAFVALLTALNLSALAQGTAFTYQGRLNDGANPANGSYDLRFALYDAASAGAEQGNALTNAATVVSNGLFTVTLDFGNQFPGANRWLEIAVRTNGNGAFNTLAPRQPITAAPYAIHALTTAGLNAGSNQPVTLSVAGTSVLRIESVYDSGFASYVVNSQGGSLANVISNGFVGGFIGGGGNNAFPNRVGGDYASVLGGAGNTASGAFSAAMGVNTTASGYGSTAMGDNVIASGGGSIAMGSFALASSGAAISLGRDTVASGFYSAAMGQKAIARNNGTFVWADSTPVDFDPFSLLGPQGLVNSFNVRSTGGFFIASAINPVSGQITSGVQLSAGSGTWASYSDRNAKTNFAPVNSVEILNKLVAIPVATWNYKAQADHIRHIGPMAQDFAAAFGVGEDDVHITTIDADGVALAAIQGLNEKLEQTRAENAELKQELAQIKQMLTKLSATKP